MESIATQSMASWIEKRFMRAQPLHAVNRVINRTDVDLMLQMRSGGGGGGDGGGNNAHKVTQYIG